MAFTLHQYLKYYWGGERKINGNVKPFTKAESHFADAKLFKEDPRKETMSTIISTSKVGIKNGLQMPKEDSPKQPFKKEESK